MRTQQLPSLRTAGVVAVSQRFVVLTDNGVCYEVRGADLHKIAPEFPFQMSEVEWPIHFIDSN